MKKVNENLNSNLNVYTHKSKDISSRDIPI